MADVFTLAHEIGHFRLDQAFEDPEFVEGKIKDRVTRGSRILDIRQPMDKDGRRRELTVMALERL